MFLGERKIQEAGAKLLETLERSCHQQPGGWSSQRCLSVAGVGCYTGTLPNRLNRCDEPVALASLYFARRSHHGPV